MSDITSWAKKPKALQLPALQQLNPTQVNADTRTLAQNNWLADKSFQQQTDPNVVAADNGYKQWVVDQQNLGGAIDPETQNAVVRGALQSAGTSGILGSRAGTGLVARDLGLTSMDLERQRQQQANQLALQNPTQKMGIDPALVYGIQRGNTDEINQRNLAQASANYKAANTDSFLESLAKGLVTEGTVGAVQAANERVAGGKGEGGSC